LGYFIIFMFLIFIRKITKIKAMKATQLTPKQIEKIVYALELTYGNVDNYDKVGMGLAKKISNAKAVITAK